MRSMNVAKGAIAAAMSLSVAILSAGPAFADTVTSGTTSSAPAPAVMPSSAPASSAPASSAPGVLAPKALAQSAPMAAGSSAPASSAPGASTPLPAPNLPITYTPELSKAANDAPEYRIGPEDTLQVFVWRNADLSVTVPVRPDGRISTPLNEDMSAVGKTPQQLARDIEIKLADYIKKPTVNIIVTHPASKFSQISIVGQVKEAHELPFEEGMTALQAVMGAGGPTEFAALKRAKVIRMVNGKRTEIKLNLDAIMQKGNMDSNLVLKAGDVIVVPEARF